MLYGHILQVLEKLKDEVFGEIKDITEATQIPQPILLKLLTKLHDQVEVCTPNTAITLHRLYAHASVLSCSGSLKHLNFASPPNPTCTVRRLQVVAKDLESLNASFAPLADVELSPTITPAQTPSSPVSHSNVTLDSTSS
jgi:hypothetical protein